jgi:serine/threonine-protein kinase
MTAPNASRRDGDAAPAVEHDIDFATLAIAHGLLTREDVEAAEGELQQEALEGAPPRQIEDVLLEQGVLTAEQVWAVYKARERMMRDARSVGWRIGGYEILGVIGEGGLGVVYKGRQLSMGRIVALKVLHEKWVGDDEFRKRFLVEARLVGRLSHPNLIQVYDVGRYKNTLYYSMEFVDGEAVEDKVQHQGRLDLLTVCDYTIQTTRALQYLYACRIVHRDVKPGNILVTRHGVAKLGDFGFVQSSLEAVLSSEGEVLGTPDYISPEAARGDRDLDFRSDLYSLGASVYHMLTGAPPFGGSPSEVMESHIREPIPSIRSVRPDLPPATQTLLERLLAKDRRQRYPSFGDLFDDLELLRLEALPRAERGHRTRESVVRTLARGNSTVSRLARREEELSREIRRLRLALAGAGAALAAALLAILWLWLGG